MITYLYDGTFPGLLTAVYRWLHGGDSAADITAVSGFKPDLFSEPEIVETNTDSVRELIKILRGKLTKPAFYDLYFCFLAEEAGIERVMARFIQKSLTFGSGFAQNYADETVRLIRKTSDRVAYEIHRMHGFVRFRKMCDGLYYAPIEPDHNILELLAPHFTARFADQPWFIHDLRRCKGLYYDGVRQCRVVTQVLAKPEAVLSLPGLTFSAGYDCGLFELDEPLYQVLWNEYFQEIAISERENKRLQQQHMPRRYRKHMIERIEE